MDKKNRNKNIFLYYNKNVSLKKWLILFIYPIYTLFFCSKIKLKKIKKKFKYGFRLYSNGLALGKFGSLDWLIADSDSKKKNSLFVLEDNLKANNSKKYESLIESEYNFCNSNRQLQSSVDLNNIFQNFKLFFKSIPFHINLILKFNEISFRFYYEGIINFYIWNNFCENYELKYYITYHNYQFQHYFRNIMLKKNNCKTIHYKATNSENIFNYELKNSYKNARMAMMYYDVEYHQTIQSLEMSKTNKSLSSKFHISGPTFINYKNKDIIKLYDKSNFNILMFNTTYNSYTSTNSVNSHFEFLNLVDNILDKKKYYVFFKSKKNFDTYFQLNNKVKMIAEKLSKRENFVILKNNMYSNSVLIDNFDLAISMPFASPLTYSIYKKKNLIYCDLLNQYPNSYFKNYENICVNNIEKVIELIDSYYLNNSDKKTYNKLYLDSFGNENLGDAEKIIMLDLNKI